MNTEDSELPTPPKHETPPSTVAMVVLLTALAGFGIIGPFVGLAIAYPFYPDTKTAFQFMEDITDPMGKDYMKMPMMIVQGASTLVGLALVPAFFWFRLRRKRVITLIKENPVSPIYYVMAAAMVLLFMGPNSVFIEWNSNIDLPDGKFETWAKNTESLAFELTKFLASFANFGQYLLGVFVIALLPGIAEELVFRGFLQPELHKMTGNIHAGIWISAIFFSALHLQFYGFFPRVMLGALFGYIYFWSGSLSLAMFCHFVNNFLGVTAIYTGLTDVPGVENDTPMPFWALAISTTLFGFLAYRFQTLLQPRSRQPERYIQ